MNNSFASLKEALRNGDAEGVIEQGFKVHLVLPNEELTEDIIPSNPSWT